LQNSDETNEERLTEQLNKLVDVSETRKGEFYNWTGNVRLDVALSRLRVSIAVDKQ